MGNWGVGIRGIWRREKIYGVYIFGRGKSVRVINYEEFKKVLEELVIKRFKGKSKEEVFDVIC